MSRVTLALFVIITGAACMLSLQTPLQAQILPGPAPGPNPLPIPSPGPQPIPAPIPLPTPFPVFPTPIAPIAPVLPSATPYPFPGGPTPPAGSTPFPGIPGAPSPSPGVPGAPGPIIPGPIVGVPTPEPSLTISMTDTSFQPARVEINEGESVRWLNSSSSTHTVTADPAKAANPANVSLPSGASVFDSGSLAPGQEFVMTFTTPGEYRYVCLIHESIGMLGTVVVKPK